MEATKTTTTEQQPSFNKDKFIAECGSKSNAIRKLTAQGKTRGEVAKLLQIKYQHVRNVLITPVKNPKAAPVVTK